MVQLENELDKWREDSIRELTDVKLKLENEVKDLKKKLLEMQANKQASNTVAEDNLKRYTEMNSKLTVDNEVLKVQLAKEQSKTKSLESDLTNLRVILSKNASLNGQQAAPSSTHPNIDTATLHNEIQELKQLIQTANTMFKENLVTNDLNRKSNIKEGSPLIEKPQLVVAPPITKTVHVQETISVGVQINKSASSENKGTVTDSKAATESKAAAQEDEGNVFLQGEGKRLKSLGVLPSLP